MVKIPKIIVAGFEPSLFYFLVLLDLRAIGRLVTADVFSCCPLRPRVFVCVDSGVVDG